MVNFKKGKYRKDDIDAIPEKPGVYVISGPMGIGRPDYIGKSKNLRRRAREHLDGDVPDFLGLKSIKYKVVRNYDKTNMLERGLIRERKPRLNKIRYKNE